MDSCLAYSSVKKPLVNLPLASKGPHVGWKTAVKSHIMYIHTSHSMHVCVYISGCYIYTYAAKMCPVIKMAPNLNTNARLINTYLYLASWHQQLQNPLLLFFFFFLERRRNDHSWRCFHNCCSWLRAEYLYIHGVSEACLSLTP